MELFELCAYLKAKFPDEFDREIYDHPGLSVKKGSKGLKKDKSQKRLGKMLGIQFSPKSANKKAKKSKTRRRNRNKNKVGRSERHRIFF